MGFTAQSRRSLLQVFALVSLLAAAEIDVSILTPATVSHVIAREEQIAVSSVLAVLSDADQSHYRQALGFQRAVNYTQADAELALVENPLLKSTLLGERYQNKDYTPRYEELVSWLAANADAPAAEAVYRVALAHKPADAAPLEEPLLSHALKGVSNGYARGALRDNKTWQAGLAAFKHKNMAAAAQHFRQLAEADNNLSADDKAAASFWAYRAYKSVGEVTKAAQFLDKASDYPSGFYSLLARRIMGESQSLPTHALNPTVQEMTALLEQLPAKRAVALKEIGEDALAEQQLRALYPKADKPMRRALMALAQQLDLPAMQMRMAGVSTGGKEAFPMPSWQPASGYQVERALLFAIMRQESGFDPNARSASGAMGLMQLMPATAHAMARENHGLAKNLDPSVNIALGQRYLEHLMSAPHIGDNLIYLTAAYNAGPGTVASWLRNPRTEKDPLLFVESLPYPQTRDYVVHVVANYWVYSQMLEGSDPASLSALAAGQWPRYEGAERQLVALLSRSN